jgi:heptosyltransferase-1
MVEEAFAAIPAMHANVRRVIPVASAPLARLPWHPSVWSEIGALRRTLAAERYDLVVDTQGLVKSAMLASLAPGAKHGMDRSSARESLAAMLYDVRHAIARGQHAVDRNRQLARGSAGLFSERRVRLRAARFGRGAARPWRSLCDAADDDEPRRQALAGPALVAAGRTLRARAALRASVGKRARAGALQVDRRRNPDAVVPAGLSRRLARLMRGARCAVGVDTGLTHLSARSGADGRDFLRFGSGADRIARQRARTQRWHAGVRKRRPDAVLAALEACFDRERLYNAALTRCCRSCC